MDNTLSHFLITQSHCLCRGANHPFIRIDTSVKILFNNQQIYAGRADIINKCRLKTQVNIFGIALFLHHN